MASGSYAQTAAQRLPLEAGVTRQTAMPSNQWSKPKKASPWVLWMAGAVCFVAILISIGGVLIPHSTPSSYLATGGGQSYAIQVGGDQARAGYLACGADYRSVTRKES